MVNSKLIVFAVKNHFSKENIMKTGRQDPTYKRKVKELGKRKGRRKERNFYEGESKGRDRKEPKYLKSEAMGVNKWQN